MSQSNAPSRVAEGLLLTSDYGRAFSGDVRLRRAAERGQLHRISRGLYFDAANWERLTIDQRYEARVRGIALGRDGGGGGHVLSHQSAAVLWGLPILTRWPEEVHFLTDRTSGGRSVPGLRRHAVGIDPRDVAIIDGMSVTTVARTVVDLAATIDLKSAVAAADRAIHVDRFGRTEPLTTQAELFATLDRMLPFRGSTRAKAVISFARPNVDSPNESGSRVNIALNGFPEPELQHPFSIQGRRVETDFYWREQDAVGEADGKGKYFDRRMMAGRTTAEVVFAEKEREDALRRQVRAFTRWDFATGMNQQRLRARLLQLGLPVGRPRLTR